MRDKWLVREYLLFAALFLLLVPFLVTLNDVITRFVLQFKLYAVLESYLAPLEIHYVKSIVGLFGVIGEAKPGGLLVGNQWLRFNWNCLGWQSMLLYFVSAFFAFRKTRFTMVSKLEALFLGILWVFWVNIMRISFLVILAVYAKPAFYIIFHDIFAAFVTVVFLFFYWWFAFRFVLQTKHADYTN